jgi:hypothetical protein
MKKITLTLYSTFFVVLAHACDVCGGAAGGGFGVLPQFQKSFIGTRWQSASFLSEHLTLFDNEIPTKSNEKMNQIELWGRYVVNEKLHFFGSLPYRMNQKIENDKHWLNQGIGDITIQLNYVFIHTGNDSTKKWKQALQGGAGLKLPSGKYDSEYPFTGELIHNMQLGSGSIDIPFHLIYTLRNETWGFNFENNFRWNTMNREQYKFGNQWQQGLRFFLWKPVKSAIFLPQLGLGHDFINYATSENQVVDFTKIQQLNAIAAVDVYWKNFILQAACHLPLAQNAGDRQLTVYPRYNLGFSYLLPTKIKKQNEKN